MNYINMAAAPELYSLRTLLLSAREMVQRGYHEIKEAYDDEPDTMWGVLNEDGVVALYAAMIESEATLNCIDSSLVLIGNLAFKLGLQR